MVSSSGDRGGALYIKTKFHVLVHNAVFSDNIAEESVSCFDADECLRTKLKSHFYLFACTYIEQAGAAWVDFHEKGSMTITDSRFVRNKAKSTVSGNGGAVRVTGYGLKNILNATNCDFLENKAVSAFGRCIVIYSLSRD